MGRMVLNCFMAPIHTPPGHAAASQRNSKPAATFRTRLIIAQQGMGRRRGSLMRQIETAAVMRRAIAPSHTGRTAFKNTQSHGTASACHNADKTMVAAQAPINPNNRRLPWSLLSAKTVQTHAATKDPIKQGKNEFIVVRKTAGLRCSSAKDPNSATRPKGRVDCNRGAMFRSVAAYGCAALSVTDSVSALIVCDECDERERQRAKSVCRAARNKE